MFIKGILLLYWCCVGVQATEFSKELDKRRQIFGPASKKASFEDIIDLAKTLHYLVSYGVDFASGQRWGNISLDKGPTQEELLSLKIMYVLVGGGLSDSFYLSEGDMTFKMNRIIDAIFKMNGNLSPLHGPLFSDINHRLRALTQVSLSLHLQWEAVFSFSPPLDPLSKENLRQQGHRLIDQRVDYYYGQNLSDEWKKNTIAPRYKALSQLLFETNTVLSQPSYQPQPQVYAAPVHSINTQQTPVHPVSQPNHAPFNDAVFIHNISDHKAFICPYPNMTIVSWNMWAKGTRNGFNIAENDQQYIQLRYPKVLQQLASLMPLYTPAPIIALQEMSGAYENQFKADIEKGSTWRVDAMKNNVTGDSFKNAIIYDSTLYTIDPANDLHVTDTLNKIGQEGRFQYVTLTDKTSKVKTDIINVHLKWGVTTPQQLSQALLTIQNICTEPTIVIGDFNMDLRALDPNLQAHTVIDGSRVWRKDISHSAKNTTDGYVIFYPQ